MRIVEINGTLKRHFNIPTVVTIMKGMTVPVALLFCLPFKGYQLTAVVWTLNSTFDLTLCVLVPALNLILSVHTRCVEKETELLL